MSQQLLIEEWREVGGEFAGAGYEVSNTGRVSSKKRGGFRYLRHANDRGYRFVQLCVNGKPSSHNVHRLVAEAFHPADPARPCVNHKNCLKDFNYSSNLEWVTHYENTRHALRNGRMPSRPSKRDKGRCNTFNLTEVRAIRELRRRGVAGKFLARWFGVSDAMISRVYRENRYNLSNPPTIVRMRRSKERKNRIQLAV